MEDATKYDDDYIHRIAVLIAGHIRMELNAREKLELQNWIDEKQENKILFDQLCNRENIDEHLRLLRSIQTEKKDLRLLKNGSVFLHRPKKERNPRCFLRLHLLSSLSSPRFYYEIKKANSPPLHHKRILVLPQIRPRLFFQMAGI